MNQRTIIILILLGCLAISNATWYLKGIDSSLTIDSISQDLHYTNLALEELKLISVEIDQKTSKDELIQILKTKLRNSEIFELDGNVYSQNLGFIFKSSKLQTISLEVPVDPNSKG